MRIIPVVDLRSRTVVRAVAGNRSAYRPIVSTLLDVDPRAPIERSVAALARAFRDRLGSEELYLADLDAIETGLFDPAAARAVRAQGLRLALDAGAGDPGSAAAILPETDRLIVGLESIARLEDLRAIARDLPAERLVFSLDLRDGRPIVRDPALRDSRAVVDAAIDAGFPAVILLDLARVGTGSGTGTEALLRECVRREPGVEWIVGGGLASLDDLLRAAEAGASAALVGSALHDGRIDRTAIERVRGRAPAPAQQSRSTRPI
ncbi:MAG: HisA/HisF-related TIM barrel protein [Isosphaeraceae bacterium]|nr:HisA/HisF-related TIM barrel protein [Isosphaeraceae bacterium]